MPRLAGKTALITGANRGIGRGTAEGFAEEGATVGVNHPPTDEAQAEAAAVVGGIEDDGGDAVTLEADVSDADMVRSMVESFENDYGTVDVLVNNAGIATQSPLAEMPVEMWDEMIAVDLRGVFLATRFTLPGMLEAGDGKIINIASQLGFKGAEGLVHYCAAKGGVIAMTRALAQEVAPEVTVNGIAPGPIRTDILSGITEEWMREKKAELPLSRLGEVEDVVPTAVFLASSDGDYYTGQVLSPDGGDAMH
jgi:3-oxoacyl-[acyl-carrier protein] reductase